jgi:hypothetical protein
MNESRVKEPGPVTLEQVYSLAKQLPLLDKVRLIERIASDIERDIRQGQSIRSSPRVCADLGPAPSAKDIDELRREMCDNSPRKDTLLRP